MSDASRMDLQCQENVQDGFLGQVTWKPDTLEIPKQEKLTVVIN